MFELKIYFYNKPNKVGELSNMTADQSFVVRCLDSIISIEYSMKKNVGLFSTCQDYNKRDTKFIRRDSSRENYFPLHTGDTLLLTFSCN